jgi:dihydroxyacetone kinase
MHGFVGEGGLDVSVAGQVFASPSTGQVMEGLRLLSSTYKEILIVVNNYTGDRLNFGLAAERAKIELGIRCRLFCFGDDVAFDAERNAKTGRRGLAGGTFLNMCLGQCIHSSLFMHSFTPFDAFIELTFTPFQSAQHFNAFYLIQKQ